MTIEVKERRKTLYVPAENILRMEAASVYTVLHEKNGSQHVMCTHLGQVMKRLSKQDELQKMFFRVNRSQIINLKEVTFYQKGRGGKVVMSDNVVVAVAQRRKTELLNVLKKLK